MFTFPTSVDEEAREKRVVKGLFTVFATRTKLVG